MSAANPRERFREICGNQAAQIDLAEAALWIAAEDSPPVSVTDCLARLDSIAEIAAAEIRFASTDRARAEALNRSIFVEQRFSGNRDDFYDPRNSWLHEVIDRKLGIPISLAIVYIATASRLGMDVRGISFPGHFLVKHVGGLEIVVDPFSGRILDHAACAERLTASAGSQAVFRPAHHLRAASEREILVRLLSNLEHIWLNRGDPERALACCDRILLLTPDAPDALRNRGLVYERLELHAAALADFERSLLLAPSDPLAATVRARVMNLRTGARRLH
jgi:regulator of sirC expression with transglutaminase-like and TPR domain